MMSLRSYVLGHEAMKKMSHASVLISGMKGLGVEIGECKAVNLRPELAPCRNPCCNWCFPNPNPNPNQGRQPRAWTRTLL
jgi:hypothetical protein